MSGDNAAPAVYGYQNQAGADSGAINAIGQIPGAVQATGYNPASSVQQGQQIINSVQDIPQYAQAAMQSGFDPQNALYDQTFQRNQQQNLAAQAAQGVATTPYGAGMTAQANQNFNMDWMNQQLARQAQGAQTAQGLMNTYGTNTATGAGLQQAGGQFAASVPQMQAQDYMNYLTGGTQASNASTNAYNATNASSQAFWNGVGKLGGAAFSAVGPKLF